MLTDLEIRQPKNDREVNDLHAVLQQCLRDPQDPYLIQTEYPLVLGKNVLKHSYVVYISSKPAAHLSLLTKLFTHADDTVKSTRIGFVGNVCVTPAYRGHHLSEQLLKHVSEIASNNLKCDALLLWSDLTSFYQKIGFAACGSEFRVKIPAKTKLDSTPLQVKHASALSMSDIERFLDAQTRLRLPFTAKRDPVEIFTQAKIPEMVFAEDPSTGAMAFMGKGCDMRGVVHDWACSEADALPDLCEKFAEHLNIKEVLLLVPEKISLPGVEGIYDNFTSEKHPVGLVKILNRTLNIGTENIFVWGLDSI